MLDTLTAQAATTALDFQEAPAEPITIDPDYWDAYGKKLIKAVIEQAKKDAARGDRSAVEWLQWDGLAWAEAAGWDIDEIILKWIRENVKPAQPHKPAKPRKRRSTPVCVQPTCAAAGRRTGRARKPRKSRQEAHHAILTA